jgi:uncharacterized membrane protein YdbT with pleckstrin-like domain
MGVPQRLLGSDESVVIALRPHVKVLLWPAFVLLLAGAVGGYTVGIVPDGVVQPWLRGAVVVVALLVLLRFVVWPFLVWWNTVYAVTNRRLIVRQGVLSRAGHDMPLSRLNDVSFSHNLVERVLGCGTLVVESAGERGQLSLADVPHVEKVQRTLYRLSDEARAAAPAAVDGRREVRELGSGAARDGDSGDEDTGDADEVDDALDDDPRRPG